ncbi:hypothetical protein QS257_05235 [Terrilactibacillus sp. S3-3]|nr:hypothetical protein QS257_05235 [Terrilactibacillus sp. S3-3]
MRRITLWPPTLTPKAFRVLEQSDKGLYGLVAANGMGEAFTGKDMFGHPVSARSKDKALSRQ